MNILCLALVKWLSRAVFGALSADGDATGGTAGVGGGAVLLYRG